MWLNNANCLRQPDWILIRKIDFLDAMRKFRRVTIGEHLENLGFADFRNKAPKNRRTIAPLI